MIDGPSLKFEYGPLGDGDAKDLTVLRRMPDDCSLDGLQYHLYVLQSIERGQADAKAERTISHREVARELRKKWLVDSAGRGADL